MTKKPDTEALCEELLKLHKRHEADFASIKEIKSILIAAAAEAGENAKIVIPKLGIVKVSAPKDKHCTGTAPEIVVEVFLAIPERERKDLLKRGIVVNAEQWTGKYYGAVTAELFSA